MFSLAVKRYMDSRAQYATEALEEPTLEKVIRSGSEWIDEGGTEADLPDGPSPSGLLRLVVGGSTGWRDELVGCGNLDSQIAGSSR